MKKRSKFGIALLIYCLVLIVIIGAGLFTLRSFLVSYEASRPDNAVEAFFEEKDRSFWLDGLSDVISAELNEFTSPDAGLADFGLDPDADITWRSAAGGDDSGHIYDVKLGSAHIAQISLVPDEDVGFDMSSWRVDSCSFLSIPGSSITICVPSGCTAYVNDIPVGSEYFSGNGQTGVTLEHEFDIAPSSDIYIIEDMRGPAEIKAYDENGLELDPVGVSGSEVAFLCQPEHSVSFYAASNARVFLNGIEVTGSHASSIGENLDSSVSFLYYEFKDLYTLPEVSVTVNDAPVSPSQLSLGTCYFPGAQSNIDSGSRLGSFIENFIHAYVDFGANKDGAAEANFAALSTYLVSGTELYQTCYATVENIAWATTSDLVYHDTGCYDLMPLPNGDYVCHITYDVSYQFATTKRDIKADYVVLIQPVDGGFRVVAMSPEL